MKKLFSLLVIAVLTSYMSRAQDLFQSLVEKNSVGNSNFGYAGSSAGDVNGDGYNDIIVGAPYYPATGCSYIYFGGNTSNKPDVILKGDASCRSFGIVVSSAGDVNNDGYDDVIVGASGSSSIQGYAYIFFGGATMDSNPDVTLTGEAIGDNFGCAVSFLGDINKDGFDDVVVGANEYSSGTGRAYIYFGGSIMNCNPDVVFTGFIDSPNFGCSVASAGDVNNDGFNDLLVSANNFDDKTDCVYIFYGGNSMDSNPDIILTIGTQEGFGCSVSSTGDVNGDGYDDVIVGSRLFEPTGRAYIFLGGSDMDSNPDLVLTGAASGVNFGCTVASAGDVNNDGYNDVIVGADGYVSAGHAYIYFGGSSMDNLPDVVLPGETGSTGSGSSFGCSVASAGDVNKDGFDDVMVGAWQYNSGTGRAYVYYGGGTMDSNPGITLTGEVTGNWFGYSVASAGDVNNDGYDDLIVGAYGYNKQVGSAYIYFGGSSTDSNPDVILTGVEYSFLGISVASAGDVNSDGYDDVIVGASYSSTGHAFIYFGGSSMDSNPDVILTGTAKSFFGNSVSSAGDVNKDGFDDVIVGAHKYNTDTGCAYIYFGGSGMDSNPDVILIGTAKSFFGNSVSSAGDVNKDGYSDVIVGASKNNSSTGSAYIYYGGSSVDNSPDVVLTGEATNNLFGSSVSSAGDINKDGFDDVIVGAYGFNSSTGRVYLYLGGNSMDGNPDLTLSGEASKNYFGYAVSSVGDLNCDGYSDVVVGAWGFNSSTGRTYIFYGGETLDSSPDLIITGENAGDSFGLSVASAGDINKNGHEEIIVGAPYFPVNGKTYIYTFDSGTGITNIDSRSIELYPNPSNGSFYFSIKKSIACNKPTQVNVFDMFGKKVWSDNVFGSTCKIDLLGLQKGFYIVKFTNDNISFVNKVLLQ